MNKLKILSSAVTVASALLSIVAGMLDDRKQEQYIDEKIKQKLNKDNKEES